MSVEGGSITFADIDNDDDPDLLITGENNSGEPISKLYRNITHEVQWTGAVDTDWNNPNNWNKGLAPIATDNVLIKDGPNQPLIDAPTTATVENLNLNTNTNLSVEGVLQVSKDIINDGTILFKSNATSTGQFDEFTGTLTGSGEVSVERFIPQSKRAFRYISSSVSTTESINANLQEGVTTASHSPKTQIPVMVHTLLVVHTLRKGLILTATN